MQTAIRFEMKSPTRRAGLCCISLLLLISVMWTSVTMGQVTAEDKTVYLSGQLTNSVNGAPISNYKIYILSDSIANNGFYFYSTIYTDVNGFYFDTLITNQMFGTLKLYLYDYYDELVEAEKYYRFNWSVEYHMITDFQIHDPNATNEFQANFYATPDTVNDESLLVTFHDISTGYTIKSWWWDFGDGYFSDLQFPDHEYRRPGIYQVTLIISSKPPEMESSVKSKITKQVMVGMESYFDIGGHIYSGYFPIDYGYAYLYKMNDLNQPEPIDTTEINQYGYYYFYQIIEGNYMVKARLRENSAEYGNFIPTYYGDVYDWSKATIMEVDDKYMAYHIHLIQSDELKLGDSYILGKINYDTSEASGLIPARNIEIILLNDNTVCLTCNLSDLQGNFIFGDLPYGTYQLLPDVTGILSQPIYVTLSAENPSIEEINVIIQEEQIKLSVNEMESDFIEEVSAIYPNPSKDEISLRVKMKKSGTCEIFIHNIAGQIVHHGILEARTPDPEYNLSVVDLKAGCYSVSVVSPEGIRFSSKFIKL